MPTTIARKGYERKHDNDQDRTMMMTRSLFMHRYLDPLRSRDDYGGFGGEGGRAEGEYMISADIYAAEEKVDPENNDGTA